MIVKNNLVSIGFLKAKEVVLSYFLCFCLIFSQFFFYSGLYNVILSNKAFAYSQVVVGVTPDGSTNTTTDKAQNGTPVVNIAAPNNSGLSHNKYTDYNVTSQNLILNNSIEIGVSQSGGVLYKNPNFNDKAASTILNEITSNRLSRLEGYTEVFGQRANVIVANPNGIYTKGAGFINTDKLLLVTGKPNLSNDSNYNGEYGNVKDFDISSKGVIVIEGRDIKDNSNKVVVQNLGLDASTTTYTDLISRVVKVRGDIYSNGLDIKTGNNKYDVETKTVSSIAENTRLEDVKISVDASELGSMYAGRISIVATEDGFGVKTMSNLVADVNDIEITANGDIEFHNLSAARDVRVVAGDSLSVVVSEAKQSNSMISTTSQSKVYAGNDIEMNAGNIKLNGEYVYAENDLNVEVNTVTNNTQLFIQNDININSQEIINNNTIEAIQDINVNTGSLENNFTINVGQNLNIKSDSLINNKLLYSAQNLSVTLNDLSNNGIIYSENNTDIQINELNNKGTIQAQNQLNINSFEISNSGTMTGVSHFLLAANILNNLEKGQIVSNELVLDADNINNEGVIYSVKNLDLELESLKNSGTLSSENSLIIKTNALNNSGEIVASDLEIKWILKQVQDDIAVVQDDIAVVQDDIAVVQDDIAVVQDDIAVVQDDIAVVQDDEGSVLEFVLNNSGIIQSANNLNINTKGELNNIGTILAYNYFNILAKVLNNENGFIQSGAEDFLSVIASEAKQSNTIIIQESLNNNNGTIISFEKDLNINVATNLNNQKGLIYSNGDLVLNANSIFNNITDSKIYSLGGSMIDANDFDNSNNGYVYSGKDLIVNNLNNNSGLLESYGNISIINNLNILDNTSGRIVAFDEDSEISILTNKNILNTNGQFLSMGNISFDIKDYFVVRGKIHAYNDILIKTNGVYAADSSNIQAGGSVNFIADGYFYNSKKALLLANDNINVKTKNTITNAGLISSGKNITLDSGDGISNQDGAKILGGVGSTKLIAKTNITNKGYITSLNELVFNTLWDIHNYGQVTAKTNLLTYSRAVYAHKNSLVFSNGNMKLHFNNLLRNQAGANFGTGLYAKGNMYLGKVNGGKATAVQNYSSRIQTYNGSIDIRAKSIANKRTSLPRQLKPVDLGFYGWTLCRSALGVAKHKFRYNYVGTASEEAKIISGNSLYVDSITLTNDSSSLLARKNISIIGKLNNINHTYYKYDRMQHYTGNNLKYPFSRNDYYTSPVKKLKLVSKKQAYTNAGRANLNKSISRTSAEISNPLQTGIINPLDFVDLPEGEYGMFKMSKSKLSVDDLKDKVVIANQTLNLNQINVFNPDQKYLIETNIAFIDVDAFKGGLYFLTRLGIKPNDNSSSKHLEQVNEILESEETVFLGDAYYEHQLIKNTINYLTFGNDVLNRKHKDLDEQINALYESAFVTSNKLDLEVGKELSEEQTNDLEEDIVWYVYEEVEGKTVLVPKLFLAEETRNDLKQKQLDNVGAVIAADNIDLFMDGDLYNQGSIVARDSLRIQANNIFNSNPLSEYSKSFSSLISAGGIAEILVNDSILNSNNSVIKSGEFLSMIAGRDISNLTDSVISTGRGYSNIVAGNKILNENSSVTSSDIVALRAGKQIMNIDSVLRSKNAFILSTDLNPVVEALSSNDIELMGDPRDKLEDDIMGAEDDIMGAGVYSALSNPQTRTVINNTLRTVLRAVQDDDTQDQNITNLNTDIVSEGDIIMSTSDKIINDSLISAGNDVSITADALINNETIQAGNDLSIDVDNDIINYNIIRAENDITLSAGWDIILESQKQNNSQLGGYYETLSNRSQVISSNGSVILNADNDVNIIGANIDAAEDINITAGNDVNLEALKLTNYQLLIGKHGFVYNNTESAVDSNLTSSNGSVNVTANAGEIDLASTYLVVKNNINLIAKKDITITTTQLNNSRVVSDGKFFAKSDILSNNKSYLTAQTGDININSGVIIANEAQQSISNVNVLGSELVANDDISIIAKDNVNIVSVLDTVRHQGSYKSSDVKIITDNSTVRNVKSQLTASGDLSISSGDNTNIIASDLSGNNGQIITGRYLDSEGDVQTNFDARLNIINGTDVDYSYLQHTKTKQDYTAMAAAIAVAAATGGAGAVALGATGGAVTGAAVAGGVGGGIVGSGAQNGKSITIANYDETIIESELDFGNNLTTMSAGDTNIISSNLLVDNDMNILTGKTLDKDSNLISVNDNANLNIGTAVERHDTYTYAQKINTDWAGTMSGAVVAGGMAAVTGAVASKVAGMAATGMGATGGTITAAQNVGWVVGAGVGAVVGGSGGKEIAAEEKSIEQNTLQAQLEKSEITTEQNLNLLSANDLNITASNITTGNDASIVAINGEINIQSGIESETEIQVTTNRDFNTIKYGQTRSSLGADMIASQNQNKQHQIILTQKQSNITSVNDLTIQSKEDANILGSNLIAQNDINVTSQEGDVNVLSQEQVQTILEQDKKIKETIGAHLSNKFIEHAYTAKETSDNYSNDKEGNTNALANTATAAIDIALTWGSAGFASDVSITRDSTKINTHTQATTNQASNILTQQGDINLTSSQEDINITGSNLISNNGDINLVASNDINIQASKDSTTKVSSTNQDSEKIGMSPVSTSVLLNLLMGTNYSKTDSDSFSNSETYNNSTVTANNGAVNTDSGNDTTMKGVNINAKDVEVNVGNDLLVASLQDSSISRSKTDSESFGLTQYSETDAESKTSRNWVGDQTTIIGSDGVNITVGDNTHIKGAVIANAEVIARNDSDAAAIVSLRGAEGDAAIYKDKQNLTLTTKTLTYEDILDHDIATDKSRSIDIGINKVGLGLMTDGHEMTGVTKSTLGQGTINIANTDESSNLNNMNRDLNNTQEVTSYTKTGGYDFEASVNPMSVKNFADKVNEQKQIANDNGKDGSLGKALKKAVKEHNAEQGVELREGVERAYKVSPMGVSDAIENYTGHEMTWKKGGSAVYKEKDENKSVYSSINFKANNIGNANTAGKDNKNKAGKKVNYIGFLNRLLSTSEGSYMSTTLNYIPGFNNMSIGHDKITDKGIMSKTGPLQLSIIPAIAINYYGLIGKTIKNTREQQKQNDIFIETSE